MGRTRLSGTSARAHWPGGLRTAVAGLSARRPDLALDVRWFEAVTSTMDVAAAAATEGAPPGLVVIAERQVAGRGRRGRSWESPAGAGLYFSCLVRPTRDVELITLAAGVGVLDGVTAATGLRPQLKWPNDLLVGRRKLAGVLAEGAHLGTADASVVLGVGVNLEPAAYPAEVAARATSIRGELGRSVPGFTVFAAVVEHLLDALGRLERGDASGILRAWRAASPSAVGTTVRWSEAGRLREGVTAGLDERGALLVRSDSGPARLIAGEVEWDLA